jgi:carboxypeptidase Taq
MNAFESLKESYGEIADIESALSLLAWDQATYMPRGGASGRGFVMGTLASLRHEKFLSETLDKITSEIHADKLDREQKYFYDEFQWNRARARRLPDDFVRDVARAHADSFNAWLEAKKTSNFKIYEPHLTKVVELSRRASDYFGFEDHPLDAHIVSHERDLSVARLKPMLTELREGTVTLLRRIMKSPNQPDMKFLDTKWDTQKQWDFGVQVIRDFGYDIDNGRQDKTEHPFMTEISPGDVRVTTRLDENDLFLAMSGTMHEAGHAMYQQGMPKTDARSPLRDSPGSGMHESQSRLWEVSIGQSMQFWNHYFPKLQAMYPQQLAEVTPGMMYAAINKVSPTFIRTEADEVTYNLHIALRFELEQQLLGGTLAVKDLPDAWNGLTTELFGITPKSDRVGCLQDVHWSEGSFGYFPSYSLGNIYAAMLMEKIEIDIPQLWEQVSVGNFKELLAWLREHVHRFGKRLPTTELMIAATGKAPTVRPLLERHERKYGKLYAL